MKDYFLEEVEGSSVGGTAVASSVGKDFFSEEVEKDFFSKEIQPDTLSVPQPKNWVVEGLKTTGQQIGQQFTQFGQDIHSGVMSQAASATRPFSPEISSEYNRLAAEASQKGFPSKTSAEKINKAILQGLGGAIGFIPKVMVASKIPVIGRVAGMGIVSGAEAIPEGPKKALSAFVEGTFLHQYLKMSSALPKPLQVPTVSTIFMGISASKNESPENIISSGILGAGLSLVGRAPSMEEFRSRYAQKSPLETYSQQINEILATKKEGNFAKWKTDGEAVLKKYSNRKVLRNEIKNIILTNQGRKATNSEVFKIENEIRGLWAKQVYTANRIGIPGLKIMSPSELMGTVANIPQEPRFVSSLVGGVSESLPKPEIRQQFSDPNSPDLLFYLAKYMTPKRAASLTGKQRLALANGPSSALRDFVIGIPTNVPPPTKEVIPEPNGEIVKTGPEQPLQQPTATESVAPVIAVPTPQPTAATTESSVQFKVKIGTEWKMPTEKEGKVRLKKVTSEMVQESLQGSLENIVITEEKIGEDYYFVVRGTPKTGAKVKYSPEIMQDSSEGKVSNRPQKWQSIFDIVESKVYSQNIDLNEYGFSETEKAKLTQALGRININQDIVGESIANQRGSPINQLSVRQHIRKMSDALSDAVIGGHYNSNDVGDMVWIAKPQKLQIPAPPETDYASAELPDVTAPKMGGEGQHRIELPEVVKLAKELTGNVPIVKKLAKSYGLFKGKNNGEIVLSYDIFKNPDFASAVLAHEIGHLADWLPDRTMKRGNVLGRLFTLRSFLKETLETGTETISADAIKTELKALTQWWNPFDEKKNKKYTGYRYSSPELYAEFISVLLNQPKKAKELAPESYRLFWDNVSKKPQVQEALVELNNFIGLSEMDRARVRDLDIRQMAIDSEKTFYISRLRNRKWDRSALFNLRMEYITKNTAVIEKMRETEKSGKFINPEDNPLYFLNDYNYLGGKITNLLEKIDKDVVSILTEKELTLLDMHAYMFSKRIIQERSDLPNPRGHTPRTATAELLYLESSLGTEKFNALETATQALQGILKPLIIEAEAVGLYKPETVKMMIENPAYATFQVNEYITQYITSAIIEQKGTLKDVANVFTATVMKMVSTIRAIERIKARNGLISFLQKEHPEDIELAKTRRLGEYKTEVIQPDDGRGVIETRMNGEFIAFYVDPYIAQAVNYTPSSTTNAVIGWVRFANRIAFRPLFVTLNIPFQTFNFVRDFWRNWLYNPYTSFIGNMANTLRAIPKAQQSVWGKYADDIVVEMRKNGMLSITFNELTRAKTADVIEDESQYQSMMQHYNILEKRKIKGPIGVLLDFIVWLENIGNVIERIPKIVRYIGMKEHSGLNIKEIAQEVRTMGGSPDFLDRGLRTHVSNELFLFSNAMIQATRADINGAFKNPRTRSGFWWKSALVTGLPRVLMFLAILGFFGKETQKNYKKQSPFDRRNYITFPIWNTPDGKAIYLRLPQPEFNRLIGAVSQRIMDLFIDEHGDDSVVQDILNTFAGQLPSPAPVVELGANTIEFLVGRNPSDFSFGGNLLSRDEQSAGGLYRTMAFLTASSERIGLLGKKVKADDSDLAIFLKVTPLVSRYIRISDVGEKASKYNKEKEVTKKQAQRRLRIKQIRERNRVANRGK